MRLCERKEASTTARVLRNIEGQRNMFRLLCEGPVCSQRVCVVRPTSEFGALESPEWKPNMRQQSGAT